MKALLVKDSMWFLMFGVAGFVAQLVLIMDEGIYDIWIEPEEGLYPMSCVLFWVGGTALGLLLAVREEICRTRDYLWHRPVSRSRIFGARLLGGLIVMLVWLTLPLGVHYCWLAFTHVDAHLMDGARFWYYFALGSVVFPSYAAGYFAASLTRHPLSAILLAALPSIPLAYLIMGVQLPLLEPWVSNPLLILIVSLAIATALLVASYWNERQGQDMDLPFAPNRALLSGLIVLIAGGGLVSFGLNEVQSELHGNLQSSYPRIILVKDEARLARMDYDQVPWVWRLCDRQHRELPAEAGVTELPANDKVRRIYAAMQGNRQGTLSAGWRRHRTHFRGVPWEGIGGMPTVGRCYLDRSSGLVLWIQRGDHRKSIKGSRRVLGKGEPKRPFSSRAVSVHGRLFAQHVVIGDPEDGSLWRLDTSSPNSRLEPMTLPDGDKFAASVDLSRVEHLADADAVLAAALRTARSMGNDHPFAVHGEKRFWLWNRESFVPLPDALRQAWEQHRTRVARGQRARYTNLDPILPAIHVVDDQGKTVFAHEYEPHTFAETLHAGMVRGASLLRLPVVQVWSWSTSTPRGRFRSDTALDPLLAGGKRGSLLLTILITALILALLCWMRLRRLQAETLRQVFWTTSVLLTGLFGFLVYRLFENERAWRRCEVIEPQSAPGLLIKTA